MLTTLSILVLLCVLIWLPIVFQQINRRGFVVLLIWLLIAPIATNLVHGDTNPFFTIRRETRTERTARHAAATRTENIEDVGSRTSQLLQPTRLLFYSFLFVFVLGALLRKKSVLPLDRTEILMAVFSLMLIGDVLLRSDHLFFSLRVASDAFIVPFCAYYVARRLVVSENHLRQIMRILGYLGCYLIIIVLVERLANHGLLYRVSGPFGLSTPLYYVMAVVFFAALLDSVHSENPSREKRVLPDGVRRFVLCLTPVVILLTWSRGSWVGFLSGVWLFSFLGYRLMKPQKKLGWTGTALILVAAVGFSVLAFVPNEVVEGRIAERGTVEVRFPRWNVAIQEGTKNPVFGIGLNNLRDVLTAELGTLRGAHNSFLTLFAELGAVGLLVYLAIVASIIQMGLILYRRGAHSRDRWRGITVITLMTALLIPALFSNAIHGVGVNLVYIYVTIGGIAGLYDHRRSMPVPEYRFARTMAGAQAP